MHQNAELFQPSKALYSVILGAFRMEGTTLGDWARREGLSSQELRQALLGVSATKEAGQLIERAVAAAGRDNVERGYKEVLTKNLAAFARSAA